MKLFKAIREALIDFWYGVIRPALEIFTSIMIFIVVILAVFITLMVVLIIVILPVIFMFNMIGHSAYP